MGIGGYPCEWMEPAIRFTGSGRLDAGVSHSERVDGRAQRLPHKMRREVTLYFNAVVLHSAHLARAVRVRSWRASKHDKRITFIPESECRLDTSHKAEGRGRHRRLNKNKSARVCYCRLRPKSSRSSGVRGTIVADLK